ncbi:MAG: 50S ribosomal protein L24 [Bacilli bacterium]
MRIKVGDTVKVITGESKNKTGKVIAVLRKKDKVVVENINMIKKHIKPNGQNEPGGIREMEAPIHKSNVKVITKEEIKAEKKVTAKKVTAPKAEKKVTVKKAKESDK